MQYLTTQGMATMQYVPELDYKLIGYGVLWMLAIVASVIGVIAFV